MRLTVGSMLAFAIGAGCRWFALPAPAPPTVGGALLIVAMTLGYVVADRFSH